MIIDFDRKNKGGGGKEPVVETLNVTANGSYTAPSGVDGFTPVNVNVPQREPVLESLSVTDNGTYTPSTGKDGFDSVDVNVPKEHHNVTSKSITANGTYNSTGDDVWNRVEVNVPEKTLNKASLTKEYTANGQYSIATPSGYDGISDVNLTVAVPERQPVLDSLSVTDNGTYTPESGVDGYNSVSVNVPKEHHNVTSKSITANGVYNSTGDEVWNEVSVNVPERQPVVESLSVTANGTYTPKSGVDGFNSVNVNVPQSGGTGFDLSQLRAVKFSGNLQTIDLSGFDTSNFDDMSEMFRYCSSLTSLDLSSFNTSNVTDMSSMFYECSSLTSLDLSSFNTSNVTNMGYMFGGCRSLTSLDLSHFNTSNVTKMDYMFNSMNNLTSLNLSGLNTSKVKTMSSIFWYNEKLTTLDISGWSFEEYYSWESFSLFYGNVSLTTIISNNLQLPDRNLGGIGLDGSPKLTVDSIVGLLNALPQSTNNYSFQIGTDNIAKLSDDQKAIATNKGWTLV